MTEISDHFIDDRHPIISEYALYEYHCWNRGKMAKFVPGDAREMQYCPFCGEEL